MNNYSEISIEIGFENQSSIKLTQGPYRTNDPQLSGVKAAAIQLNQQSYTDYQPYIVDAENSPIKATAPIIGASITTVSRTTYI